MNLLEKKIAKAIGFLIALFGTLYLGFFQKNTIFILVFVAVVFLGICFIYLEKIFELLKLKKDGKTDKKKENRKNFHFFLGMLVVSFILFVITRHVIFSITIFVSLILLFLQDIIPKEKNVNGVRKDILELIYALDVALICWVLLILLLKTAYPIDVITSCSMLPKYERGDMIFLQGGEIRVPTARFDHLPSMQVKKELCTVEGRNGEKNFTFCTTAVILDGKEYLEDENSDVIVYEPNPSYYGLIIHRAFLKLEVMNETYYLTKGDNNPSLDQEAGIQWVSPEQVHGKVIARIPYVGFFKLFLFMQFNEPKGCEYLIKKEPLINTSK